MGYYATGNGSITFSHVLEEGVFSEILERMKETFECDGERQFKPTTRSSAVSYIDFWSNDKYYSDEVEATLNAVSSAAPISDGEICYHGEDGELWRFIYKDGRWIEEDGHVEYFPLPTEKVVEAFRAYVENDLKTAGQDHVSKVLTDICGLTPYDLKMLRFWELLCHE